MPLPENSRLTFYKFMPETPTDHFANLRETDRWASQLPTFGQQLKKVDSTGTWSTTSTSYTHFGGAGFVRISGFKKYHSWTNLYITAVASGNFASGNNHIATLGVRLNGVSSGLASPSEQFIAVCHFTNHSDHKQFGGELLLSDGNTPQTGRDADTYTVDLMIKVLSGTFQTDANDHVSLSIIECIP